jgi:hypothetical protein
VKQEHGRQRRQGGADLQAQDGQGLSRRLRQPFDREEQDDRRLGSHEELPEVGGRPLVRLRGGSVQGEEQQHDGEGGEGHGHGKERARVLQHGSRPPFTGWDRFRDLK